MKRFDLQLAVIVAFVGVTCAYPQLLLPASVSQQSGIIRNVPTTLVGLPANNILSDRDRAIIAQIQIDQLINSQLNNNAVNRNNVQDQINREIAIQTQARLRNLSEQLRNEQLREQLRDQIDRSEITNQRLVQTQNGLNSAQLRALTTGRLL